MPRPTSTPKWFHDTVTIPVRGRPEGLRVLVNEDGQILTSLVELMELPKYRHRSASWQSKLSRAVGLLYDYLKAVPDPKDALDRRAVLSRFVQALMAGTIREDGTDPSGLYWRPLKWKQIEEILTHVNRFSDFCEKHYGSENLNPRREATFHERLATLRRLDNQNKQSLLKHLGNAKSSYAEVSRARTVRAPQSPKVRPGRRPVFPRDRFGDLLQHGFRRKGRGGPLWKQYNIREMMLAILQRHGGLRASEWAHIFVTDVLPDPTRPGMAEVRLYHPSQGAFTYRDPITRRITTVTRQQFLMERYGRKPRTQLKDGEKAGWKNLMLDEEEGMYALVRWFPTEWGAIFYRLYELYLDRLLPKERDHPYLFVNLDQSKDGYSNPYQLGTYHKTLANAVRSIGLQSKKALGTTSHGLRHAYGQDLTDADVDDKVRQLCLHHNSIASQEVYTLPSPAKISSELEAGRRRLAPGTTGPLEIPSILQREVLPDGD